MGLSREDILKANDLKFRDVEVPEWGGFVRVRELTARERVEVLAGLSDPDPERQEAARRELMVRVVWMAAVRDDGSRLFTEQDLEKLGSKSYSAMERLFDAIFDLSGMLPKSQEEAGKG